MKKRFAVVMLLALVAAAALMTCAPLRDSSPESKVEHPVPPVPSTTQPRSWSRGHAYAGVPRSTKSLTRLENIGYQAGYCEVRKNPLWVAFRVFRVENPVSEKRPGRFRVDNRTKARVGHDDYTRSGYDRGHMAPSYAIATRYGREAQLETFLMSNIAPQKPVLNQQVWSRLEMLVAKDYANRFEEVWVICGPVFSEPTDTLPSGVAIPAAFYKILADEVNGSLRVLAFVLPQGVDTSDKENLESFLTSVRAIERQTGLDFLHELPDALEERLETLRADSLW